MKSTSDEFHCWDEIHESGSLESKMETIGVPKQKWDGTRERLMRVLLDEHETILSSYQAQKYGGGEG